MASTDGVDERRPGDAGRAARPARRSPSPRSIETQGDQVRIKRDGDTATEVDRRHDAAGALGDRPVRRGPLPVVQGDHGGEEEAAGDLRRSADLGVDADQVGLSVAWTEVEETTERPPRTAGEIVTDEDGSGATALAEFLASKKFI